MHVSPGRWETDRQAARPGARPGAESGRASMQASASTEGVLIGNGSCGCARMCGHVALVKSGGIKLGNATGRAWDGLVNEGLRRCLETSLSPPQSR